MSASYIEQKVPSLMVQDVLLKIPTLKVLIGDKNTDFSNTSTTRSNVHYLVY